MVAVVHRVAKKVAFEERPEEMGGGTLRTCGEARFWQRKGKAADWSVGV